MKGRVSNTSITFIVLLLLLQLPLPATADTARISSGGAAHQLAGGGTVSMVSETVRMQISDRLQEVDCTFNFENVGPSCRVRIGFPDFTNIPDLTSEETASNPKSSFLSYRCSVGNVEVKSELVASDSVHTTYDDIRLWHASEIEFPANSKVTVRASYSQLPDLCPMDFDNPKLFLKASRYILQTASSWNGPVKQADIYVTFDPKIVTAPIELVSLQSMMKGHKPKSRAWWDKATMHSIAYGGSVAPSINGQELHFVLKNLRPTEKDDLVFMYRPTQLNEAKDYYLFVQNELARRKPQSVYVPSGWHFPNRSGESKKLPESTDDPIQK